MKRLACEPIGHVENDFAEATPRGWEDALSRVVIEERWAPALESIEDFTHVYVLFWLNRVGAGIEARIHPEDRQDVPAVGLFATRTPRRPNPIGLTLVELVSVQGNVLTVRGLDALHGTPVLDLKPYLPRGDCVPEARVPAWVRRLWGED